MVRFLHRDPNPYRRWLLRREFWDRWGPWLALIFPLLVAAITVVQLMLIRGDVR